MFVVVGYSTESATPAARGASRARGFDACFPDARFRTVVFGIRPAVTIEDRAGEDTKNRALLPRWSVRGS